MSKMINNLKTYNKNMAEKNFSLTKKGAEGVLKGAAKGVGIAGAINTAFPALVPTISSMIAGASNMSVWSKIGFSLTMASSPAVQISGLGVLAIGAGVGALVGGTVSLIKGAKYKRMAKNLEEGAKTR